MTADREIGAAVLMLTTFDREDYLFEALSAGASGFLLKNASPERLIEAVRVVARGDALLSPEVTRRVIERAATAATGASAGHAQVDALGDARADAPTDPVASPCPALDALTQRELEVLHLIAEGLSNAEIAGRLYLGEATVKTHVSKILMKLELRDRVHAVVFAYENGVVTPGDD
jgi:DNA-binding NarL/FixJ family response regulator